MIFKVITTIILLNFLVFSSYAEKTIIIQSTTSIKNSGFYDYILPLIKKDLDIRAKVIAVGSGAAIKNTMNCDGDLLIVHSPVQEKEFISKGYAEKSYYFMHNYFVIIGPKSDPAGIKGIIYPEEIFKKIFNKKVLFISRGDNSGTHNKELGYWNKINLNPIPFSGKWYLETGTSMGATINTSIGLGAYTLSDKASWLSFSNKLDHVVLLEGTKSLFNPYSAIAVNKNKCPMTKLEESQSVIRWLLSEKGREKITNFKKNGEQLFFIKKK